MSSSVMWPILAEMCGDAVGARFGGEQRGADRIGIAAAARVAHGRHVIDIDPEAKSVAHFFKPRLPGLVAGIAASDEGSASAG